MNKFLAALLGVFVGKIEDRTLLSRSERQCKNSPTKEHEYEVLGRYLIPAKTIQTWSRLESKLKCHHCDHTVGPQRGSSSIR